MSAGELLNHVLPSNAGDGKIFLPPVFIAAACLVIGFVLGRLGA